MELRQIIYKLLAAFRNSDGPLLDMIRLCRQEDWDGLWKTAASCQEQVSSAARWFYMDRVTQRPPESPSPFIGAFIKIMPCTAKPQKAGQNQDCLQWIAIN